MSLLIMLDCSFCHVFLIILEWTASASLRVLYCCILCVLHLVLHLPKHCFSHCWLCCVQEMRGVQPRGPWRVVGYSFGACIAFEMAVQLQQLQQQQQQEEEEAGGGVRLCLLDGSHAYVAAHTAARRGTEAEDEAEALCAFLRQFDGAARLDYRAVHAELVCLGGLQERLRRVEQVLRGLGDMFPSGGDGITRAAEHFYRLLVAAAQYRVEGGVLAAPQGGVTLIKAATATSPAAALGHDYGLAAVVQGNVKVVSVPGDHTSFIAGDNARVVADIITATTTSSQ
jgi:fatty acid synthase